MLLPLETNGVDDGDDGDDDNDDNDDNNDNNNDGADFTHAILDLLLRIDMVI